MSATAQDIWHEQADEPQVRIDGRVDPEREDAHWQRRFRDEPYYRHGLTYDDYAPAYCVGYIGFAQYGGCYEDAEKSLCANWLRIKGDARLELEDALCAIRAAWEHAAGAESQDDQEEFLRLEPMPGLRGVRQPAYATA